MDVDDIADQVVQQPVEHHDPLPVKQNRFCLAELAADYEFFNHGLLFTVAGFAWPNEDPLGEWKAAHPDAKLVLETLAKPWIRGLDDWSAVIVAVD